MTKEQFDILKAAAEGKTKKLPVALIVDSPWIPGFVGIKPIEYFTEPEIWLSANLEVVRRFPQVIFIPGFWVEYGMAVEPSAFGCKISWWNDSPPSVTPVLRDISEVDSLSVPLPKYDGLMPFVLHLQRWVQQRIEPLGYSIRIVAARGPLTLAVHLRGVTDFLTDIKIAPEESHRFLEICTQTVIKWLSAQIENLPYVEGILVLDDIVGLLSPTDYDVFAHPYLSQVFGAFPSMLKIYHNDANILPFAERLAEAGFHILNFSHEIDIGELAARVGQRVALMGNVPPLEVLAKGSADDVRRFAAQCIEKSRARFILSAGGGTSPGTPAENIDALIAASEEVSVRRSA
ncbi:MAG: uroporphyrinogen decarboxylase family protein [Armatimonadota bacterium]|nr:uroporphyrinogen decarboxylase family protein [Armatimonadota bacterium]